MVELEINDPDCFGLWLDGNMPSAYGTLPYIKSRRYLLKAGYTVDVLRKYNLYNTDWKTRAPKDEVLEAMFSALVENELIREDKNEMPDADMYIMNPPGKKEANGKPLLLGPRPSNARRRSTYRQIILTCDSQTTTKIKEIGRLLKEVLRFSHAPIRDYPCPNEFCEQAVSLLQYIKALDSDPDCTKYLIGEGYKVSEFHWRAGQGPFSRRSAV